jgi:hypothetical protein
LRSNWFCPRSYPVGSSRHSAEWLENPEPQRYMEQEKNVERADSTNTAGTPTRERSRFSHCLRDCTPGPLPESPTARDGYGKTILLERRETLHSSRLYGHLNPANEPTAAALHSVSQYLGVNPGVPGTGRNNHHHQACPLTSTLSIWRYTLLSCLWAPDSRSLSSCLEPIQLLEWQRTHCRRRQAPDVEIAFSTTELASK